MKSEAEIKNAVKRHYANLATVGQSESCCETSCCSTPSSDTGIIPMEALAVGASCGSPLSHITLQGNETILDLGSGGGIDVFRASKMLKSSGKVIGVDATPEMIFRARETAKKYDYKNVEFRLGEIEHMPIESNSMDLVISNCVLNLVPDKRLAFKEIYRVLKPGGKISISDMVATQGSRKIIKPEEWAACIAGAVTFKEYQGILEETGFRDIKALDETHPINEEMMSKGLQVKSVAWMAQKPS